MHDARDWLSLGPPSAMVRDPCAHSAAPVPSLISTERAWASSPSAFGKGHGSRARVRARLSRCRSFEDRRALHEVEHAESLTKTGHCARWGARGWSPPHSRRSLRACGGQGKSRRHSCHGLGEQWLRDPSVASLQVLRRDPVDQRRRLVQGALQHDHRAKTAASSDGGDGCPGARLVRLIAATACVHARLRAGRSSVIRIDWDVFVVLGLGQQVGGEPGGIVGAIVRHHQHLGGAGDHVDADGARTPVAWRPPHRRCRGPRSYPPARSSRCRGRVRRRPARRPPDRSR